MIASKIRLLPTCVLLILAGPVLTKAAHERPSARRIVARANQEVNAALAPPEILGRRFWNMLSAGARTTPAPAGDEPMVREAAICYHVPALHTGNDRPVVNADRLRTLKPEPDPRVPFVVYTSAGRPPFRCLDDFQVDRASYEKWRAAHPNFLGFWTGVEWDNEYLTALNSPKRAAEMWHKRGYSETAFERMQDVMAQARTDRRAALQGLRTCYDGLRRYYFNDPQRMMFLRGGWCFDHYALEWGAALVISETTNTGNYRHQVSLFNVRGAARQYGKPWEWYIATYYNGHDEQGNRSVNNEPNYVSRTRSAAPGSQENSGPEFGMSVSLNRRDMYLAYLAGASFVDHEDWNRAYLLRREGGDPQRRELSPHGLAMREWYAFTQRHPERGVSYAPVALLLPFDQGYPQWGGNPWSCFPIERADAMIDAFLYTVVPHRQDTRHGQEGCLSNSPLGDIYDVLLPNPPSGPISLDRLRNYPVAILLGAFDLDAPLAARLADYVRAGGTLVVNVRQANGRLAQNLLGAKPGPARAVQGPVATAWGERLTLDEPYDAEPLTLCDARPLWTDAQGGVLASVKRYGQGHVVLTAVDYLLPRVTPAKGAGHRIWQRLLHNEPMPLVENLLRHVVDEVLPLAVAGDIEYGLNRVPDGWWLYLINNRGVTKFTQTPATLDPAATARVTVDLRDLPVAGLRELCTDKRVALTSGKNAFTVEVGPGDIRVVHIATRGPRP